MKTFYFLVGSSLAVSMILQGKRFSPWYVWNARDETCESRDDTSTSTSLWKFFEVLYLVIDLYTLVDAVGAESDYVQLDVKQHAFFVRNTKLLGSTYATLWRVHLRELLSIHPQLDSR